MLVTARTNQNRGDRALCRCTVMKGWWYCQNHFTKWDGRGMTNILAILPYASIFCYCFFLAESKPVFRWQAPEQRMGQRGWGIGGWRKQSKNYRHRGCFWGGKWEWSYDLTLHWIARFVAWWMVVRKDTLVIGKTRTPFQRKVEFWGLQKILPR